METLTFFVWPFEESDLITLDCDLDSPLHFCSRIVKDESMRLSIDSRNKKQVV